MSCIFCKIINKEEPTEIVYEDDKVIAIKDINPKAPVHLLIIPKKHIASVAEVGAEDKELVGELILAAKNIAKEKNLNSYKLLINVGREAGQIIEHLHIHLFSNNQ